MYRKTFVEINLDNLSSNIKNIVERYNNYKYYIGMIKSNAYGHGYYIVNTLINAGINYLAVSSLDEAINVRNYNKEIPILCTEIIDEDLIDIALENNVTLTIDNINYLKKIENKKCKIHIKLDTGMNRIGVKTKEDFNILYTYIKSKKNIYLEGIYTHFATPGINDKIYDMQIENFKKTTEDIDLKTIPIVHLTSSFSLLAHPKIDFANGVRIGTIMYGYDISLKQYGNSLKDKLKKARDDYFIKKYKISPVIRGTKIDLKPAFKLKTNVMEIRDVKKGEIIGYGKHYVKEDTKIAVLPIGYDEGLGLENENRYVLINNKKYKCIGPICMCMMFAQIDDEVKLHDEVTIMGDSLTLGYMSRLKKSTIAETLINLGKNLNRVYVKDGKIEKII